MKRIIEFILVAAMLAAAPPVKAQPVYSPYEGWFNHLAIGTSVGGDGLGVTIVTNFAKRFELRAGASWMPPIGPKVPFKISLKEDWEVTQKVVAKGAFAGSRANLMLDFHPIKNHPFRLTAGVFYEFDSNIIRGYTLEPMQIGENNWGTLPYRVNGQQFTTDPQGYVRAGLAANKVRPYLGFGSGYSLTKTQNQQWTVDVGVVYLGKTIPYSFDYSSGRQETVVFTYETMQELQDTILKTHAAVDSMGIFTWLTKIRFMPVIRLMMTFRAF